MPDLIDADHINRTIDRALNTPVLPTHTELKELEADLRRHIHALLPVVAAQTACPGPVSKDWAMRRFTLARARAVLLDGPGAGLRSAAEHVNSLAHVCRALLGHRPAAREEARPAVTGD
ncbi:DUF6415 family natural product biosynthesis protein [Streptomyces roseoverticillatus]|uniref:DUF6415 family natural product biosynthesis protein n=1 Tax=Streptomyces roseoverticillatus TaxID=66429 RepID=UPI0004C20D36|nr:DUF6415 family natural product biosynthesis protein [Streptomyces roseoverticillatus]